MTEEFDPTKVAAEFLRHNLDRVVNGVASSARDVKTQIRARLERTYKTYVSRLQERHGRGKSFFIRSEPIPLYDFFVPLDLATQIRTLKRPGALSLAASSKHSVITGTGGSGKSMMMRHLLISALASGKKTPVFMELRLLNQSGDTLKAGLVHSMQSAGLDADASFLEAALADGQLFVLLDGFDEVAHARRKQLAMEVREVAQRHPENWVVMSSRPDAALEGWDEFTLFRVQPLDLDSAVDLVVKLPFEDSVKERFVLDMKEHLFERHTSFLSNPLLLSIMLLTYSDVAHIPHKLSTFYSQAFESLFHRHDALKGGFQRDRRSGLDVQDFGRAFAAFSVLTYDSREFSFLPTRALEVIDSAKEAAMLSFDSQAFLDDAVQAVCLLLEEGMEIGFAHRSFQEFFAARFIHTSPPEVKARLVERFAAHVQSDSVLSLLHEIDPYVVERYYILPNLRKLREKLGVVRRVGASHFAKYLRLHYSGFRLDEFGELGARMLELHLNIAETFAYARYRSGASLVPKVAEPDATELLRQAFVGEVGSVSTGDYVPVAKLKTNGPFLRALSEHGHYWSQGYVQALMDIEREIEARHAGSEASLAQLLASGRKKTQRARTR